MRQHNFNRQRGFSLVEVLISLSVFTIVMFAIYTTFASGAGTFAKGDAKADIHMNTRAAMELMGREIRLAGYFPENLRFIIPGPPGLGGCNALGALIGIPTATTTLAPPMTQIRICGDIDGDNNSELVTYTWVGDTDGDAVIDPGENEIRRQVTMLVGGLPQVQLLEVIAFNISNLQLSYIDRLNNPIPAPGNPAGSGNCPDNIGPGCDFGRVIISITGSEPVAQSAAIGGRSRSPFATRVRNFLLVTDVRPRNLGL